MEKKKKKKRNRETSLVVQRLRLHLPMKRVRVRFLVGKLRSHMLPGQKNQNINNRGNIVINSIETLKMVHIKKKIF